MHQLVAAVAVVLELQEQMAVLQVVPLEELVVMVYHLHYQVHQ
jgi:hypothetical protein